jgi:alkanesulfonate monooxygenase SsuD/methylene tetrahydromethanopterin reductase-like flavin-dependent oxidoreductase (luciferase family)
LIVVADRFHLPGRVYGVRPRFIGPVRVPFRHDTRFEHRAIGYPTDRLVSRFEEALAIISRLFREKAVDFAGTYYRVEGFEMRPRGPPPSGPPMLIGTLATGARMLRLTAQYADCWDGWVVFHRSRADVVPALRERVDAACRAQGRDPATLARSLSIQVALPGQGFAGSDPLNGSPEEVAVGLRALAAEGIDAVQVWLAPMTPATLNGFAAVLDILDRG